MLIGDLFKRDVTRAIPPVVYFHEQEPEELRREVEEYIITGGYPAKDPRATDGGIHEQFVRLLSNMRRELDKPGGAELPACWISGFYGSGKSSFAKLLGLSLDGRSLPDGRTLADALLAQDHSPAAADLRRAWHDLADGLSPMAVVFDVGSNARDDEHVHAVVVRQVQHRLGYSATSNLVAEYELKLELEKLYPAFLDKVREVHKKTWDQLKNSHLAEDYFSAALHALRPDLYPSETAWVDSRTGSRFEGKRSADEAVVAVEQMMKERSPGRTLFFVVDEVSQYVHDDDDRMLALQSFVAALGQRMKGRAWLLATGQQKLEEGTGVATAILKLKDRFPPALRVHLGVANIRDVVHKRLLRKKELVEPDLKDLFHKHRPDLALYAYRGDEISEHDFVEVYPMLPGHIGLLLDITTGLRSRSTRTQGDSHAIRGLLQLLGDLFRDHDLARHEVGRLITIDLIYDVLSSALESDVQMTLSRAFDLCHKLKNPLMARVVKAVAMLELVQDHQKTSVDLIARCLYESLGQGNIEPEVQKALDALVGESLLGFSDKTGYKLESSAGQEWQRERDGYAPAAEDLAKKISGALELLVGDVDRPSLEGLSLPWLALFSDDVRSRDVHIKDERKYTVVTVDLQFTKGQGSDVWVPRSDTPDYKNRIVWVTGDVDGPRQAATRLVRSERMIERYDRQKLAPGDDRMRLLIEERNRFDAAQKDLTEAVKAAFMAGKLYFRGREEPPKRLGAAFSSALSAFGAQVAKDLYPHPATFSVSEKEMLYLVENTELTAPPPVLGEGRLGVLALDAGRYEVTCTGRVPSDVLAYVKEQGGVTGATLLAHFGAPPHGVPPDVLRAAVLGLLRGMKLRVEIPGTGEITSVRDEGARELLKETGLKKARLSENNVEPLTPRDRNSICVLFKDQLGKDVARDNDAIVDAVVAHFAGVRDRLTTLAERFRRLPNDTPYPDALTKLERALESCRRDRRVEPTVLAVKRALPVLRDGLTLLRRMETDLTDAALDALRDADQVYTHVWPPLAAASPSDEARAAAAAIEQHLRAARPWEDAADLIPHLARLREEHRARRRAVLDAHDREVDRLVDALKRQNGFDKLGPDQRHQVLRPLREGAASPTDDRALVPPLDALEAQLASRRATAEAKARNQLDTLLETLGQPPVVEIPLDLRGREIATEADLERLLDDLRRRVLHELSAHHRVRLR